MPTPQLTPEQLLEKWEGEYSRLKAQRLGLEEAIQRARARVEAGREMLGKPPLATERKKRGRPAKT